MVETFGNYKLIRKDNKLKLYRSRLFKEYIGMLIHLVLSLICLAFVLFSVQNIGDSWIYLITLPIFAYVFWVKLNHFRAIFNRASKTVLLYNKEHKRIKIKENGSFKLKEDIRPNVIRYGMHFQYLSYKELKYFENFVEIRLCLYGGEEIVIARLYSSMLINGNNLEEEDKLYEQGRSLAKALAREFQVEYRKQDYTFEEKYV